MFQQVSTIKCEQTSVKKKIKKKLIYIDYTTSLL